MNVLIVKILTGPGKGSDVAIPRISVIPTNFPIQFKRLQFPIKVAFGMTINKAQGQTLAIAGINLETDCFGHGQLYVAFSRVSSKNNLFLYAPKKITKNIVYRNVL